MSWHGLVEINEWVVDMIGGSMERMGVNGLGLWNRCVCSFGPVFCICWMEGVRPGCEEDVVNVERDGGHIYLTYISGVAQAI